MNESLLKMLQEHVEMTVDLYRKDLHAFAPNDLIRSPGAPARSAADIVFEVILNNRRASRRLRGEDAGPGPGFPPCPPELQSAEALSTEIADSCEELLAAVGLDPFRMIEYPGGSEIALSYGEFAVLHMQYHLGQLNYLQTVFGDAEIHWG
jgi:hypothetical protein